jgi:nucleotide-binding universal stress UspA family protein
MFKHILVPIDGSELSDAAVKAACGFARLCGARLTFYHAKPGWFPGYIGGEMVMAGAGIDEAVLSAMEERNQAILADAARGGRGSRRGSRHPRLGNRLPP